MSGSTRSKLFVSYSKADVDWRDRFVRHLRENFTQDVLWVDRDSIVAGSNDRESIEEGVDRAKYAVLLLTTAYLDTSHFARTDELPMLLAEQDKGLTLLPVLVEPCAWDHVPLLKDVQLVGWPGDEWSPGEVSPRASKRAISEAGTGLVSPQDRSAARDRAVLEVCNTVSRIFGIERRLTEGQRNALPRQTEDAFRGHGRLTLEDEPLPRGGEFALVYRGLLDDNEVAVKVVPTDAWRHRVEQALDIATTAKKNLRNETFIRVEQVVSAAEVHAVAMEYIPAPTLDERLATCPGRCLEDDYEDGLVGHDFAARFYARLFDIRPCLRARFSEPADQAAHLAKAVRDLVEFRPTDSQGRFLDHVDVHRHIEVTPEDADAFRSAFVQEVIATGDRPARSVSARTRGDAWNAVLQMGIDVMLRRLAGSATAGG